MTTISFLILVSFVIAFYLAMMVYYEDRKNLANRLFALASLTVAATAFVEFICYYIETPANALFWVRMKLVSFLTLPFLLHYILIYTQSKWLQSKLTYLILYLPAFFMMVNHYMFVQLDPNRYLWGYGYHGQYFFLELFRYIWLSIESCMLIFLCYHHSLKTNSKNKLQSKYMSLTFLAAVLVASVCYTVFGLLKHPIPEFVTIITSIPMYFILIYLMKRYKLFVLNPATVAANIIATMTDTLLLVEPGGNIVNVNSATLNLLGYQESELVGHSITTLLRRVNAKNKILQQAVQDNSFINYETEFHTKSGKSIPVSLSSSVLKDNCGEIAGVVIIARDISDSREMTRKMSYQATHDQLTGLKNRAYFEEQLSQLIQNTKTRKRESALLYLDLDRFKIVNDTCGHIAGDQLLKELTSLMKKQVRGSDTIARLGGDEFGILLDNCPIDKACEIAEKICKEIHEFHFIWNSQFFSCGVSIGVVQIDAKSENVGKVLSAADQACYAVKEQGGNRMYLYLDKDLELTERQGEMQWISIITKAFQEERFCLHAQLISPVEKGNELFRFEILIRMKDEAGGLVYPNAFLPAAQRFNLMTAIDQWVIKSFFKFYTRQCHQSSFKNNFICNINLSGATLSDNGFLDFMKSMLQQYSFPPNFICFEITETIAIANFSKAISFIEELKKLGVQFALDDFGSGIMSFNYLKHLPVDYVKIDGTFIKNIITNPVDWAVVESINQIAHMRKIQTIAEFVENEAIYNKLRTIGVDFVQGYWLGKPVPLEPEPNPS